MKLVELFFAFLGVGQNTILNKNGGDLASREIKESRENLDAEIIKAREVCNEAYKELHKTRTTLGKRQPAFRGNIYDQ